MLNLLAYIDPGSTALIWQVLAGIFIVFGVVLGIWWTKITTFFKGVWSKLFGKKGNGADASETDETLSEISDEVSDENSEENSSDKSDGERNSA